VNNGVWVDTLLVFEKKNKKIREIPLGSEFKLTIRKYITEKLFSSFEDIDDCIFTKRNGSEIPPKSMIEPIKRAARIAGIPMIPRQIGTHCMRKTFANMLLNDLLSDGLPITEIFQILCDSLNQGDVRVTMKYVGWDKENAKKYTEKQTNRKLTVSQ
jgi:site-specific recombinase XerD